MAVRRHDGERHLVGRVGWLRAAVLGANDGILSTASLIVGVAAANADRMTILLTGLSGMVAGAMSMAAGEYVSVSSQADTENADIARETAELADAPEAERQELAAIYRHRGLDHDLSLAVADQLMAHDALGAHLRDELGISEQMAARPLQAATASAASFAAGAVVPVMTTLFVPASYLVVAVTALTLLLLAATGAIGARAGGANMGRASARVMFWGALAMAVTSVIGHLFGTQV